MIDNLDTVPMETFIKNNMPNETELDLNPAVQVAKHIDKRTKDEEFVTLSTGIRAKILPVAASLIQEVTTRIKDPKVPMFKDPDKGFEVENPTHPDYIAELGEANTERGMAATDAMIMFGLELIDEMPENNIWVKKLNFLGIIFNDDDEFEREFAYKKYIACGTEDLLKIGRRAGLNQEDIDTAVDSFRS